MANTEIASLRSQLAIMEERTKNLNILADDVNGVSAEEVIFVYISYSCQHSGLWELAVL